MPKRSVIWRYFIDLDKSTVKCKICDGKFSRSGRTTTPMKNHLKSVHPHEYAEFCRLDDTKTEFSNFTFPTQLMIKSVETLDPEAFVPKESNESVKSEPQTSDTDQSFQGSDDVEEKERTRKQMDKVICEMLALHNLPFSFVESVGFHRLMKAASPNYQMGNSEYFISYLCDELHPRMIFTIQETLSRLEKVSFTTDRRSDSNESKSPFALTAHGITRDFRRAKIVLDGCQSSSEQNADQQFEVLLKKWEIRRDKVHCIICDGMSFVGGVDCVLNQIQSCVVQAVVAQEEIFINLMIKCKEIIENLVKSQNGIMKIKQEASSEPAFLKVDDCSSRWKTTFDMMEGLLEIKEKIARTPHSWLEERLQIEKFLLILKAFTDTTKELRGPQVSISSVIPMIHALKYTLQAEEKKSDTDVYFKEIIRKIIKELDSRFSKLQYIDTYALATYLDPRYKLAFFNPDTKDRIQEEILELLDNSDSTSCSHKKMKREPKEFEPSTSNVHSSLANILTQSDDDDDDPAEELLLKKSLVLNYNKERRPNLSTDPLLWWKADEKFKAFHVAARQYLAPPAGCVAWEHDSASLRSDEFDSERAAKLTTVKCNLPMLL